VGGGQPGYGGEVDVETVAAGKCRQLPGIGGSRTGQDIGQISEVPLEAAGEMIYSRRAGWSAGMSDPARIPQIGDIRQHHQQRRDSSTGVRHWHR